MTEPICGKKTHGGQVCILEPGHRGICTPSWDAETAKLEPMTAQQAGTLAQRLRRMSEDVLSWSGHRMRPEAVREFSGVLAEAADALAARDATAGRPQEQEQPYMTDCPNCGSRFAYRQPYAQGQAATYRCANCNALFWPAVSALAASGAGPGTPSMAEGDDVTSAVELGAAEDDGVFCVYRRLPGLSTWSKVSPQRYATLQEAIDVAERMAAPPVPRPGAALWLAWLTPEVAAKAVAAYDDEYRRHRRSEYADFCRARATDAMRSVLLHAAQQGATK